MNKGTALITGASSGIGEALSHRFAERGHDLIVTARREDKLKALAETLTSEHGTGVHVIACDLTQPDGPGELAGAVAALGVDVDILVNNAGVAYTGNFQDLESNTVDMLLDLNIVSLTKLTHLFLPAMIARGAGRILNVGSVASFQPVPSMSLYAASKAFVLSLTEGLSEEVRGTGVSVTALCPGLTRTEMVESLQAEGIPAFMMSSPEEVAREGYEALMNREVIRVPGLANQAAVTWAKFQPRWLVRGLGGLMSRINPVNYQDR